MQHYVLITYRLRGFHTRRCLDSIHTACDDIHGVAVMIYTLRVMIYRPRYRYAPLRGSTAHVALRHPERSRGIQTTCYAQYDTDG